MTESMPPDASLLTDATLEQTLKHIGIPPRPLILEQIAAEMQKEDPDFKHLAKIIGADVALAASLIKTANSPFFGFRCRVKNVNEALMILGLTIAGNAIAGIVLRRAFPTSPALERFWDASARIARLCGWLAQEVTPKSLRPEDAYTFALFRDCGIPVLFNRFPGYEQILNKANHEATASFTAVEDAAVPTNHAMVGCLLAQSWWLPEETCLAIRHHHELRVIETPGMSPPLTSRYRIALAQLAEHLLQQQTGLSHTCEWPKLGAACLALLEIDPAELDLIQANARSIIEADE